MDAYKDLFLMQQAYATLFALANKIQVQGDKYFDGLTSRQYMAILAIAHLPEDESTLNNIARKMGTTKQSVKQLITILEEKGYVVSVPSPKDKRAVNVRITDTAKPVMLDCTEKGIEMMADLFNAFSTDEIELLWNLLKKLYSYDGEEQDGFEADTDIEFDEDISERQERVLKEFERRRNERNNQ